MAHPPAALFQPDLPAPSLNGQRCGDCGVLFFPPNPYGCEFCGAPPEQLVPAKIAGRGTLRALASGRHPTRESTTLGVVDLDDGPTVRCLLRHAADDVPAPGERVEATIVNGATEDAPPALWFCRAGSQP